jgi:hypothetical protein
MNALVEKAIERFNAINAEDPIKVLASGKEVPRELLAAERLEAWVLRLEPQASDALRLAARSQHLRRWSVPRGDYPEGRVGYLKWRKDLSKMHADLASDVLRGLGAPEALISALRALNLKEGLKLNPETQTIEDALCLSFLDHEFAEFAEKHEDDKVIDIVQKTWRKMSERAHAAALSLPLEGRAKDLVGRALGAA